MPTDTKSYIFHWQIYRIDKDRTREMWPLYETTGSPSMCVAVTCVLKGTKQAKMCIILNLADLLHATCVYK